MRHMYGIDPSYSMKRAAQFSHNIDPMRVRASKVVRSDEELEKALIYYLADKTHDSDARKEYALAECEYLDGRSTERLTEVIHSLVNN